MPELRLHVTRYFCLLSLVHVHFNNLITLSQTFSNNTIKQHTIVQKPWVSMCSITSYSVFSFFYAYANFIVFMDQCIIDCLSQQLCAQLCV